MPSKSPQIFAFPEVTPIVNIALVVLIIFMITIPTIREGIPVDTPEAKHSSESPEAEKNVVVSLKADGSLYVNLKRVSWETLDEELSIAYRGKEGTPVIIKGARTLKYRNILKIMEVCRDIGAPEVLLVAKKED